MRQHEPEQHHPAICDAVAAAVEAHGGRIIFVRTTIPAVETTIRFLDTEGNDIGAIRYDKPLCM
jgi:predicted enzyme related to lactoylglutathione lyase